jgi:hypothetical protein
MPLSSENVQSINSVLSQQTNPIQDVQQNVTSAISDPFGAVINRVFSKINSLTVNIETKIDQLSQDIVKSTDSKGRITLQGNTLVITITQEDQAQAETLKNRITNKVNSIQSTINTLSVTLNSIKAIQEAMTLLQTALEIQEAVLSLNPTTGPIFTVFKKAIKIVFLKDMIKEYAKVLGVQLTANLNTLNTLEQKFRNLQVTIKIDDEAKKGSYINENQAQNLITQDLLNSGQTTDLSNVTDNYTAANKIEYLLKVEKYGEKQLIGRAYDKFSGLLAEETAPSYISTPDDLMNELKSILNRNI